MFDKELLKKALAAVIDNRNNELTSLQEFNNFNEKDNNAYIALTERYQKQIEELDKNDVVTKNDYLLLAADFDNYKKRVLKCEAQASENTKINIIKIFLKVYDDLERTVVELDKSQTFEEKMFECYKPNSIYKGIKLTFDNFKKMLVNLGCEKIDCHLGDKFDVNCMDAIAIRDIKDNENYKPDDIVEIYQSGWKIVNANTDIVIRPTKVIVGK